MGCCCTAELNMLNPFDTSRLHKFLVPGTPLLRGGEFDELVNREITMLGRCWVITAFLTPSKRRAIGGVRARLVDDNEFVTFCNQRDLEVLLGHGQPGTTCRWLRRRYVSPDDEEWIGFCADDEDLYDDLFIRELMLRTDSYVIPEGTSITRFVVTDPGIYMEETLVFLARNEPDLRYETLGVRWARAERMKRHDDL